MTIHIDDLPGDASTPAVLSPGETFVGFVEARNSGGQDSSADTDSDWIRLSGLEPGALYVLALTEPEGPGLLRYESGYDVRLWAETLSGIAAVSPVNAGLPAPEFRAFFADGAGDLFVEVEGSRIFVQEYQPYALTLRTYSWMEGTIGADRLEGSGRNDLLMLRDGGDVAHAGGGDDLLRGGAGNDRLGGGQGDDWLIGGIGADALRGGNGADTLLGEGDDDVLFGQGGADLLQGNSGHDRLWGYGCGRAAGWPWTGPTVR